ncbi:hypothetical protein TSTA_013080 [Talaromyces stipitatus ATCC 10500]|uniref:Uncharacterized protein n=1 Tax=Talaromyces stipitatus (strain ATCC 10500 / CBS 375.48 / QM 6759 / NRRL 1006) TaxID=441959 RepID=B8MFA3_TALSN|nr:uncharacterized protein TSTA_013080 [Talaromyces stipitatus ATCC 10500]EED16202.1 hypothetical protein TSTA_013080 [Talaromyces stipitatus ATCC 10500]
MNLTITKLGMAWMAIALEAVAAILLAANATEDPMEIQSEFHSSRAGSDDNMIHWARLLTKLNFDPLIIAILSVKGKNKYSDRVEKFRKLAQETVFNLDDLKSGQDRCFWRLSHEYLGTINDFENSRPMKVPRKAYINHQLSPEIVIGMHALDSIGSAYMRCDGAAWLDDAGMDAHIGSALPNDVVYLHTDIHTGETRNTIRLFYPDELSMA